MQWIWGGLVVLVLIIVGWFVMQDTNVVTPPTDEPVVGELVYDNASADLITVELPFPGAVVGKEFSVIGKARGYWFFEASFPVFLLDPAGNQLAVGIAAPYPAGTDWMTEDMIGFKADLTAPIDYIGPATLVLKNDNPSGLPENDKSVSFEITVEY